MQKNKILFEYLLLLSDNLFFFVCFYNKYATDSN